jgi:hypothetical protein
MPFTAITHPRKINIALYGPSGFGKTYGAMWLAHASSPGQVGILDTEHESSSWYVNQFPALIEALRAPYHPNAYLTLLRSAETAGLRSLIIDSLTPEWEGPGGCLDLIKKKQAKNTYTSWRDVTPEHKALLHAINVSPLHILTTLRTKPVYTQDKDPATGKTIIARQTHDSPVTRDGFAYEYDLVLELLADHQVVIRKSRISPALVVNHTYAFDAAFVATIVAHATGTHGLVSDPPVASTRMTDSQKQAIRATAQAAHWSGKQLEQRAQAVLQHPVHWEQLTGAEADQLLAAWAVPSSPAVSG